MLYMENLSIPQPVITVERQVFIVNHYQWLIWTDKN